MAANACVLDVDSNSVLFGKNSDATIAPASTAKMLTALTVLDYCSLDEKFTVGPEIDLIAPDSSKAWLNQGDTLTVRQLLVAMLLPSGNDAAYTLAVNAGKKIAGENDLGEQQAAESFLKAMNRKATEVGAASSRFVAPDGYDADGQYTTAYDLAQIAKACLGNKALSEIMGSYRISDTLPSGREATYRNTNELLNPDSKYYYSYAVGLKTGNSGEGGSCLVSAAVINGKTYICVVMGDSEDGRFSDSLTLYNEIEPILTSYPQNPAGAPGSLERRNRVPGTQQQRRNPHCTSLQTQ
jgi:D-alanyl-D-alanine carboxypeptidase (penicillin-binding protein 5/6)